MIRKTLAVIIVLALMQGYWSADDYRACVREYGEPIVCAKNLR